MWLICSRWREMVYMCFFAFECVDSCRFPHRFLYFFVFGIEYQNFLVYLVDIYPQDITRDYPPPLSFKADEFSGNAVKNLAIIYLIIFQFFLFYDFFSNFVQQVFHGSFPVLKFGRTFYKIKQIWCFVNGRGDGTN